MKDQVSHMEHIDYDRVLTVIEKTISASSFHSQSLSLIACFAASYFFYKFTKNLLFPRVIYPSIRESVELKRIFKRYIAPLLYPILAVIFLSFGLTIYGQFSKETIIFSTTLKLVALFLFLRFLRLSSGSHFVANTAGLFLIPALILDIFGAFDLAVSFLDQFALKIGSLRISIYLIIKAFIILLILFWFSSLIRRKSKSYIESSRTIKSSTKTIIGKVIDIAVYAILIITLLNVFGVDMTAFTVIGGAIGVGVGFGLQKIASNFISGLILLFEKSIEIGDVIELDNGSIFGTIKLFSSRYTLIEGIDGKEIMVPNEDFITSKVTNWTHSNDHARIEINVGVSYGSDLEMVRDILKNCAQKHPLCLQDPAVECFITDFRDYDVKFVLFFWIGDITHGRSASKGEVMMNIYKEFKKHNIEIPFPRREVYLHSSNKIHSDN